MSQTKQEIRNEWNRKNMRKYGFAVHNEYDKSLIEYVEKRKKEGHSIASTFKEGVYRMMEDE